MNWSERRRRFRALLSGDRCVHPASVYDAISARIAEDLGFEVGMFSGSIGSMSVLGAPDLFVSAGRRSLAPYAVHDHHRAG
jgi:carboxyvinyl-carboxyphosphonate phosphorylmutase